MTKLSVSQAYIDEVSDEHHIVWTRWSIRRLSWSPSSARLFVQGASLQQLVAPCVLLRARPRPAFSPHPGMDEVELGEVLQSSKDLSLWQLFSLLQSTG